MSLGRVHEEVEVLECTRGRLHLGAQPREREGVTLDCLIDVEGEGDERQPTGVAPHHELAQERPVGHLLVVVRVEDAPPQRAQQLAERELRRQPRPDRKQVHAVAHERRLACEGLPGRRDPDDEVVDARQSMDQAVEHGEQRDEEAGPAPGSELPRLRHERGVKHVIDPVARVRLRCRPRAIAREVHGGLLTREGVEPVALRNPVRVGARPHALRVGVGAEEGPVVEGRPRAGGCLRIKRGEEGSVGQIDRLGHLGTKRGPYPCGSPVLVQPREILEGKRPGRRFDQQRRAVGAERRVESLVTRDERDDGGLEGRTIQRAVQADGDGLVEGGRRVRTHSRRRPQLALGLRGRRRPEQCRRREGIELDGPHET